MWLNCIEQQRKTFFNKNLNVFYNIGIHSDRHERTKTGKAAALFSVQYQNEVLQNKSVSFLVLESINLYIESINLNIV